MTDMIKNPTILIVDEMYGYVATDRKQAGRDLSERDFKKWYDSVSKRTAPWVTILAEDDEGRDISANWFIHEMCMWQDANSVPFN